MTFLPQRALVPGTQAPWIDARQTRQFKRWVSEITDDSTERSDWLSEPCSIGFGMYVGSRTAVAALVEDAESVGFVVNEIEEEPGPFHNRWYVSVDDPHAVPITDESLCKRWYEALAIAQAHGAYIEGWGLGPIDD